MVYLKADGSGGRFSWVKQLRFLEAKHRDNFEEIALTKLELLTKSSPENADFYNSISSDLAKTIKEESDKNPNFGFDEAQEITQEVLRRYNLEHLLEQEPLPQTIKYWCYSCEDFTSHLPMENNQHYCTVCHYQRESASSSYANTALKKFAELISYLSES